MTRRQARACTSTASITGTGFHSWVPTRSGSEAAALETHIPRPQVSTLSHVLLVGKRVPTRGDWSAVPRPHPERDHNGRFWEWRFKGIVAKPRPGNTEPLPAERIFGSSLKILSTFSRVTLLHLEVIWAKILQHSRAGMNTFPSGGGHRVPWVGLLARNGRKAASVYRTDVLDSR